MGAKPGLMHKATVFANVVARIGDEPVDQLTGVALIDEDYLHEHEGLTNTNFVKYQANPNVEPPRLLPMQFPSLQVAKQDVHCQVVKRKRKLV
jgi:hypothetical protein